MDAIDERKTDLLAAMVFGIQFDKQRNSDTRIRKNSALTSHSSTLSSNSCSPKFGKDVSNADPVEKERAVTIQTHKQSKTRRIAPSHTTRLSLDVVQLVLEFVLPCASQRSRREKLAYISQQRHKFLRV